MNQLNLRNILILVLLSVSLYGFTQQPKTVKWLINYDEAISQAKSQNMPVLLFFHGSDWCPPCVKMQNEVFGSPAFIDFAADKVLFLDVDFPYKNKLSDERLKHNKELKKRYGLPEEFSQGFPQVLVIDPNGKVLYQEKGYNGEGPKKLMKKIAELL